MNNNRNKAVSKNVAGRVLRALQQFAKQLEAGKPVRVTEISREQNQTEPQFTRRQKLWHR